MYWREITTRLAGGRSTPAMRAMLVLFPRSLAGPLALPLLVTRVRRADHPDDPLPADHLALVANLLHRRADLHGDTDSWSSGPILPAAPGKARSSCWGATSPGT